MRIATYIDLHDKLLILYQDMTYNYE